MPVTMGLTSVPQSLSHLRAKALSVAQHLSLALAQTYNCREFCTEGIGNPCHSSSVLSNQFPWNPTYVEPDKLSALWVAFCWCEVPGPIYLKPAWWSESVRLGGFMACLQPAIQSSLRCLIERKNYRHTANDMRTDRDENGRNLCATEYCMVGQASSLSPGAGFLLTDGDGEQLEFRSISRPICFVYTESFPQKWGRSGDISNEHMCLERV